MKERLNNIRYMVSKAESVGAINRRLYLKYDQFLASVIGQLGLSDDPDCAWNDRDAITRRGALTRPQLDWIDAIEQKCSEEVVAEHEAWIKDYGQELREVANICAEYYCLLSDGYFRTTAQKVIKDPKSHVLNKNEFTAMCMNKYAVKVLEEYRSEPKFKAGQMVEIRKTNRIDIAPNFGEPSNNFSYKVFRKASRGERVLAMVIKAKARPANRAIKGGKIYKILPVPAGIPIYAAEKDLKIPR